MRHCCLHSGGFSPLSVGACAPSHVRPQVRTLGKVRTWQQIRCLLRAVSMMDVAELLAALRTISEEMRRLHGTNEASTRKPLHQPQTPTIK